MRRKPPKVYHAYRGKSRGKKTLGIALAVLAVAAIAFTVYYFGPSILQKVLEIRSRL